MHLDDLVAQGLRGPERSLPPVLFYDAEGSALFEEITRTPEYYPTRTEAAIFAQHGPAIMRRANGQGPLNLVELGAGNAEKTRLLLEPLLAHQARATYYPIDVSADAVIPAAQALEREFEGLTVHPIVGDYEDALRRLPEGGPARLLLFIGSSIGNFEPDEAAAFLRRVAQRMRPQDRLLLGTDLVKPEAVLDAAYNDAAGVTARFNLNMLARLNRDYDADFDLDGFAHRAFYDPVKRRVEMHLVSLREQTARVGKLGLELTFQPGETIHTENSYKFTPSDVAGLARRAGLDVDRTWTDPQGWFSVQLLRVMPP